MQSKQLKTTRSPLWLPYLKSIQESSKGLFEFTYNGGKEVLKLNQISSMMIYGESELLIDSKIIHKITSSGIPIIIHKRNIAKPIYMLSGGRADKDDTITHQIKKRSINKTKAHIARQLLKAKFATMSWLTPALEIPQFATVTQLRSIEATHAREYWKKYFQYLERPELSRRKSSHIKSALDAHSKFISGIILRWITYHHLSAFHGFLHETTDYPSLVYDLIEPYRGIFEKELLINWKIGKINPQHYLSSGISITKELLNKKCYVPLTRQIVTHQELMHGIVLSLKYYILGKQRKFLIPMPGKPNGGRPAKVNFLLYGRHAGKTDFWKVARSITS